MPFDRRLLGLVAAQVSLGITAGILAPVNMPNRLGLESLPLVPLLALAPCQASLLALWTAASCSSPRKRLAGLVAGAAYLEALFTPYPLRIFLGLTTGTLAVTIACLLVLRHRGLRLAPRAERASPGTAGPGGLKFSIRGLMLFTAAVALLSAGARALKATGDDTLLVRYVWTLCFVAVGLVALWASLTEARPLYRAPLVFAISPFLGALFAFAFSAGRSDWVLILLIMVLNSAALLGSLLVVRSCGYRLEWRTGPFVAPP